MKRLFAISSVVAIITPVFGVRNTPRLHAQSLSVAATSPAFEVASVKRNKSGAALPFVPGSPGRFLMTNVSVRVLIQNAYQLFHDAQLVGGPDWLGSDRFDIVAKAAGNPPPEQMALMLRPLLADRFKLVVHTERREVPIYALVLARSDRRLGANLRPAAFDCPGASERSSGRPAAPPQPGARVSCGVRFSPGNITAGGVSLARLAERLAPFVGRAVVDHTGLAGDFDLDLEWTPDNWRTTLPPDAAQPPPIDPDGPSLFTALQEQLGLRLEAARAPIDVLVIDSVSQPTPD